MEDTVFIPFPLNPDAAIIVDVEVAPQVGWEHEHVKGPGQILEHWGNSTCELRAQANKLGVRRDIHRKEDSPLLTTQWLHPVHRPLLNKTLVSSEHPLTIHSTPS